MGKNFRIRIGGEQNVNVALKFTSIKGLFNNQFHHPFKLLRYRGVCLSSMASSLSTNPGTQQFTDGSQLC